LKWANLGRFIAIKKQNTRLGDFSDQIIKVKKVH
jgi:hypothetical protein